MRKEVFLLHNEEVSGKYCQAQLKQLSEPLMERISRGTFSVPGGYNLYLEAIDNIEQSYNLVPRKGIKVRKEKERQAGVAQLVGALSCSPKDHGHMLRVWV